MITFAFENAGLECSFHCLSPTYTDVREVADNPRVKNQDAKFYGITGYLANTFWHRDSELSGAFSMGLLRLDDPVAGKRMGGMSWALPDLEIE